MNLINIHVRDEYRYNIFNKRETPKAYVCKTYCTLEGECPFKKRGKCIAIKTLEKYCPYAQHSSCIGPSVRSKDYRSFLEQNKKEQLEGPKTPEYAETVLEVIGDYVYVPHAFLSGCKQVPFLSHSDFLISGKPFIKKEDFTPEAIVSISKYTKQALMGGEITDIQKKSVPLFLFHLKHKMPELYEQALALEPSIKEKTLNPIKALPLRTELRVIPPHTAGFLVGNKEAKCIKWDGEWLELAGEEKDMGILFTGFTGKEFTIRFRPEIHKTKVTITDPELLIKLCCEYPEILEI